MLEFFDNLISSIRHAQRCYGYNSHNSLLQLYFQILLK